MLKQSSKKSVSAAEKCNQAKVDECVQAGKYCNLATNNCMLPKGVTTKVNKDPNIVADTTTGVVGEKKAVNNIRKYLKKLNTPAQESIKLGPSTIKPTQKVSIPEGGKVIRARVVKVDIPRVVDSAPAAPKKVKAKKECTIEQCAAEGKLCNPKTGNCIQNTAANRRKIDAMMVDAAAVVVETKEVPRTYSDMTKNYLVAELRSRRLPVSGNKDVLINRLIENDRVRAGVVAEEEEEEIVLPPPSDDEEEEIVLAPASEEEEEEIVLAPASDEEEEIVIQVETDEEDDDLPIVRLEDVESDDDVPEELEEYELEVGEEFAEKLRAEQFIQEQLQKRLERQSTKPVAPQATNMQKVLAAQKKRKQQEAEKRAKEERQAAALLLQREAEKIARQQEMDKPKSFLQKKLAAKQQATQLVQQFLKKDCKEVGCEPGEVCSVDTGRCLKPGVPQVKNFYMLVYNDAIYHGSKKALTTFANEMGVDPSDIEPADRKKMTEFINTQAMQQEPEIPDVSTFDEFPEPAVTVSAKKVEVTVEPEEDPAEVAKILHDVSTEKPLTVQEKEIVEKIKSCLGI